MSEDHIGIQVDGILYVKFDDAKKLREALDKADAEIKKLRAALKTARRDALEEAEIAVSELLHRSAAIEAIRALGEKE
jgi:hypothetical protein